LISNIKNKEYLNMMIDKKMKEEKEEILKLLYNKIDSINDTNTLKRIAEKVKKINDLLDIYDTKFENLLSTVIQFFTPKEKSRIKKMLEDIFDKYDKRDKQGQLLYSETYRKEIQNLIEEINKECDKDFWTRFKTILGIGT
jgi:G3E family GTPase